MCNNVSSALVACLVLDVLAVALPGAAPPSSAQPRLVLPYEDRIDQVALSRAGRLLAVVGNWWSSVSRVTLDVWDLKTSKRVVHAPLWKGRPYDFIQLLAFLPDGKGVVTGGCTRVASPVGNRVDVKVIDVPSGKVRKEIPLPVGRGKVGVLIPDGKTLVVSGLFEVAAVHDLTTDREVAVLIAPERPRAAGPRPELPGPKELQAHEKEEPTSLVVSRDGKRLAVGTRDGWVSVWDLQAKRRLWRKQAYDRQVESLSFSPDGTTLASVAARRSRTGLVVWRSADGGRRTDSTLILDPRRAVVIYFPDGKTLLLRGDTFGFARWDPIEARFWPMSKSHLPWGDSLPSRPHEVGRQAMAEDGRTMAVVRKIGGWPGLGSSTARERVEIWDLTKVWSE